MIFQYHLPKTSLHMMNYVSWFSTHPPHRIPSFEINSLGAKLVARAHVKTFAWDHSGSQWKVSTSHCEKMVFCLVQIAILSSGGYLINVRSISDHFFQTLYLLISITFGHTMTMITSWMKFDD